MRPNGWCATSALSAHQFYVGVAGEPLNSLGAHLPVALALIIAATLIVLFLLKR